MNIREAIEILDLKEGTKEAIRQAWLLSVKKYHPDKIGNSCLDLIQLINAAYDFLKDITYDVTPYIGEAKGVHLCDTLLEKYGVIKYYTDCNIELIGSWLWIFGNTKEHKESLKAQGFKFAPKKKAWYFHADKIKRRYHKTWDIEKIRKTYHAVKLDTEYQRALA